MANKDRMVKEFIELVSIDSVTGDERKMADALKDKLQSMGHMVYEDNAGGKIGGNAGNLICTLKGGKKVPALLLMAHMDTVVPGKGKKTVLKDSIITSDGTTVLGGDDVAGIECILEVLRSIKEKNTAHGDIQVVFTIAEEGGLLGSKHLDYSRIHARYGLVLDGGGPIGTVAIKAPSQDKIAVIVNGKAAHAGVAPETGISAIQIAAEAISKMVLGRIDFETTANIGTIHAGQATNIVCDRVEIHAEARSRNKDKLETQTNHMKECFEKAAEKFGGRVEFKSQMEYPSYNIKVDSKLLAILEKAAGVAGIKLVREETGGGSDTNIINDKGIEAIDMSVGMDKVHTVDEQLNVDDLVKSAEFLEAIIANME
jgi:tripeptide aminopeptidase